MTCKHAMVTLTLIAMLGCAAGAGEGPAKTPGPLVKDFMGINVHTVQFNPDLYRPVVRLVRDYHPVEWDLAGGTSAGPVFPMTREPITWKDDSGKVGDHSGKVDWQKLYSNWKAKGIEVDACLQFGGLTVDKWDNVEEDAYNYGKAFAEYFGPSGNALVTSVDVGNEPTGAKRFTSEQYLRVFKAMAKGLREGDPKLTILTATTQAGRADQWSVPTEIFADHGDLYDVLNVHVYSLVEGWPTWRRSYPEDPEIEYLKIVQRTIDWRDAHAPDKEVWVTEFGYDASTQQPTGNMAKWVDVSDPVQAQWLIRSYLELARMGITRAYMYWFNDSDTPSFHAASGIMRFNTPKMSFWAMKQMQETLGEYRFSRIVKQDVGELYVYEFVRGDDATDAVWVAWSPTGLTNRTGRNLVKPVTLDVPGQVVSAQGMATKEGETPAVEFQAGEGVVTLGVSESPVYLRLKLQ